MTGTQKKNVNPVQYLQYYNTDDNNNIYEIAVIGIDSNCTKSGDSGVKKLCLHIRKEYTRQLVFLLKKALRIILSFLPTKPSSKYQAIIAHIISTMICILVLMEAVVYILAFAKVAQVIGEDKPVIKFGRSDRYLL